MDVTKESRLLSMTEQELRDIWTYDINDVIHHRPMQVSYCFVFDFVWYLFMAVSLLLEVQEL